MLRPFALRMLCQIMLAPILMASASTAVLKKNEMMACSVTSRRSALVRMATSDVCDAAPIELPGSRDLAPCSGECGGLPFTNADIASAAAARRLEQANAAGAGILAVAGPAAAAALTQANASTIEVKDLVELAVDCLAE